MKLNLILKNESENIVICIYSFSSTSFDFLNLNFKLIPYRYF